MSHPKDRRERFLIGVNKGKRRGWGYWNGATWFKDEAERQAFLERCARDRRDTTKPCSCSMCGNRRKWSKDRLTMQEKRFAESAQKE